MNEVEAIAARIRDLPLKDFASLQTWFHEFENTLWDQQIEADFKAGKFNQMIEKARVEFARGQVKEL